jgi:hypothetical protein
MLIACCDNDAGKMHVEKLIDANEWHRVIIVSGDSHISEGAMRKN